jgi:hypothetical protein
MAQIKIDIALCRSAAQALPIIGQANAFGRSSAAQNSGQLAGRASNNPAGERQRDTATGGWL